MRIFLTAMLATMLTAAAAWNAVADDDVIPLQGTVPQAAAGYVTGQGLAFIGDVATTVLENYNIAPLIAKYNPLFNLQSCEVIFDGSGSITSYSLDQRVVTISTEPVLGLNPVANALYVDIAISPAAGQSLITLTIDGNWGIGCTTPFVATATINADPLELAASITVAYSTSAGFQITVQQVALNTSDITFSFNGLPDTDLGPLIQELILDLLPGIIDDMAPELINQALSQELAGIVLQGSKAFGSYTIDYSFVPALTTDPLGLQIAADGQLYVAGTTIDACIDAGPNPGSPYTAGDLPVFEQLTPGGDPYDLALAVSDNILNQLLYSLVAKGALCLMFPFSFDQTAALDGRADLAAGFQIGGGQKTADNLIDLYPVDIPHFVVGTSGTDLALVSNPFRLDWFIQEQGRWVAMLSAFIDIDLGLSVTVTANNDLQISLGSSQVTFDVKGTDFNVLPAALIQTLLNTLINTYLIPLLSNAMPTIPLPTFDGYQLQLQEIGAMGDSFNYLTLFLNFAQTGVADRPATVKVRPAVAPALKIAPR